MASHPTFHSMKARGHRDHSGKLDRIAHGHGGHSDAPEDKKLIKTEIKKAIGEHDQQLHPGQHTRLHLATGGVASRGRKKSKAGNHVNINILHPPEKTPPAALPLPTPAPAPHPAAPPSAPMAAPPPGAPMGPRPPMGGAPGMPMMRKKGGRVGKAEGGLVDAGSKSGVGRLEKAHFEAKRHSSEGEGKGATESFEGKSAVGRKRGGKAK